MRHSLLHPALLVLPAVMAFLVNPSFGCGTQEEQFDYGEKEMKAAVEGHWTLTPVEGPAEAPFTTLTFTLAQGTKPPLPKGLTVVPQAQCEQREFVRAAGACVSLSTMPIEGKVIEGPDAWRDRPVRGSFMVYLKLSGGSLELKIGEDRLSISRDDGQIGEAYLMVAGQRHAMRAQRVP